jgi:hypothetical protein
MAQRQYSADEIVTVLRQIEVSIGSGKPSPQACRDAGITEQTSCRWHTEYGGLKRRCAEEVGAPWLAGPLGPEPHGRWSGLHRLSAQPLDPLASLFFKDAVHPDRGDIIVELLENLVFKRLLAMIVPFAL